MLSSSEGAVYVKVSMHVRFNAVRWRCGEDTLGPTRTTLVWD